MKTLNLLNMMSSANKSNCYFNKSDGSWVNGYCSTIITAGPASFLIDKTDDWLLNHYMSMKNDNLTNILIETDFNYTILTNCKYFMNECYEDEKKGIHIKYDFYYSEIVHTDKCDFENLDIIVDKVKKMILDFKLNKLNK